MSEPLSIVEPVVEPIEELHPLEFTGSLSEFFRIWIVNTLLTIATLGIYSAWAKVRTSRYFCSHTHLAGASFDYLANPVAILKGRLIVVGILVVYSLVSAISPTLEMACGVAFSLGVPWAICRSLAFRARNTAWRNIRFAFGGTYGPAWTAYVWLPSMGVMTLGALLPYAVYAQRRFMVDHVAFGTTRFRFQSKAGAFYRIFGGLAAIGIVGACLFMLLTMGITIAVTIGGQDASAHRPLISALVLGCMLPIYFSMFAFYTAQVMNLTYHGASLGKHRVVSQVPTLGLAWIYLTNGLAIIASLGLLIPWSHIRLARFRLAHMALAAHGSLEDFAAAQGEDVSSLGGEFGDALDLDLAI